jgi:hypothetical protein
MSTWQARLFDCAKTYTTLHLIVQIFLKVWHSLRFAKFRLTTFVACCQINVRHAFSFITIENKNFSF